MDGEFGGLNLISEIGGGLKFGLKLITNTIIKQKKLYYAIKNGILYSYVNERSRQAKKSIPIRETKAIDLDPKNDKEFYIIYKNKCYKMEC